MQQYCVYLLVLPLQLVAYWHLHIGWHGSKRMIKQMYAEALDNLIMLANTPGWKDYAWGKAKDLDSHPTGIYRGIKQELVKIMLAQAKNPTENSSKVE